MVWLRLFLRLFSLINANINYEISFIMNFLFLWSFEDNLGVVFSTALKTVANHENMNVNLLKG